MIEILPIEDKTLKKIFTNRQTQSESLWDKVDRTYKRNIKQWSGNPDWLARVPRGRSKIRDNRIHMAVESQINKVTSRPFKPIVSPANETVEAQEIAENIQTVMLEDYQTLSVKKTMKRGLRFLHFSSLFCIKIFWNTKTDNYDAKVADSRKVRFSKNATNEMESEFAIEEIDDKTLMDLIELFPDKEEEILKQTGKTREDAMINNQPVKYHEFWIGDGVAWIYKGTVLKKQRSPYYDFDGLLLEAEEMAQIKETEEVNGEKVPRLNGRRRRQMFAKFKGEQANRKEAIANKTDDAGKYEKYLYNHHDAPRKPYIFGTILEVEDKPTGEVTMIGIVEPLQIGVDKRKRQISDNSDFVNGITKVDTLIVNMDLADARALHYDPEGLVYGPGVAKGVTRETGTALPDMVFKDMQDSRDEIDAIFGTTATFRGEGGKDETATGRAILRQEGLTRLDEILDLVDYVGGELYNWWFQLIKVRYTESHLVKTLGGARAGQTIDLIQDDLQDGIEIKIVPGQTLPEDKLFRAEKAREDMDNGYIDLETYLEQSGGYDNPVEIAKKAMMFKTNPYSVVKLDDEDIASLQEASEVIKQITPQPEGGEEEGGDPAQIQQLRKKMKEIVDSPEFKKLAPEQQKATIKQMKEQLQQLGGVEFNRETAQV